MNFVTGYWDRWKTAGVLLLVVGAVGVIDSRFITWLFFGVIYLVAFYEATRLFAATEIRLFLYAILIWIAAGFYPHPSDILLLALAIFGASLAYYRKIEVQAIYPLLYPTVGMLFMWMLCLDYGMVSMLWMLVTVAMTDVGAFYVGKAIGQTSFCETSPNKTLEGVIGGILAGTMGGTIIATSYMDLSLISALFISLLTSKSSIFGDLFESYLKREAGVKDSGTILPGHGGVLDRVDGYLFASIVMFVLLQAFGY